MRFIDAQKLLEALRAVKSPAELALVREASQKIIDSMLATFDGAVPGETKAEIAERFRREQTARGLAFDYVLVAAAPSLNRAPSDQEAWLPGAALSLDSGGMYRGYIGDLARMGLAAAGPDRLQADLLAEIEAVQQAARVPVRAGARGGDIFAAAEKALAGCPHASDMRFVAHGMGLITHEAPRLTAPARSLTQPTTRSCRCSRDGAVHRDMGRTRPRRVRQAGGHADRHPGGWEAPGDTGRGYNIPAACRAAGQ